MVALSSKHLRLNDGDQEGSVRALAEVELQGRVSARGARSEGWT